MAKISSQVNSVINSTSCSFLQRHLTNIETLLLRLFGAHEKLILQNYKLYNPQLLMAGFLDYYWELQMLENYVKI